MPSTLTITDWGRLEYTRAWEAQSQLLARRLAQECGDTLVFTEHDPVFTLGVRPGSEQHLLWSTEQLKRKGISVVQANRGGDITYHGPGQIVGYPVVSLVGRPDLHAYLRFLEEVLIESVGQLGVLASRRPGLTGIWVGSRKIAALGIAMKRWVTYHGFALNGNVDLNPFAGIVPCGITPESGTVTSLAAELGRPVDLEHVKTILASEFARQWPLFLGGS